MPDLKEAKVDGLKYSSSAKQFQILMRKDFWYVLYIASFEAFFLFQS